MPLFCKVIIFVENRKNTDILDWENFFFSYFKIMVISELQYIQYYGFLGDTFMNWNQMLTEFLNVTMTFLTDTLHA